MPESNPPDVTELIRLTRQGDTESRDRLFELCRNYLRFSARAQVDSRLRVKVDASDIVQQTLLEAHRDLERFQGSSEREWMAWLRKIMAHNVADFARHYRGTEKRELRREVPIRDAAASARFHGAPEPAAREATPSQEFLRLDDKLRVLEALGQLPPDYQEVIVLRNFERLPFNDVAQRMDRSRPAAQMLWKRALEKLQSVMSDEGENDE